MSAKQNCLLLFQTKWHNQSLFIFFTRYVSQIIKYNNLEVFDTSTRRTQNDIYDNVDYYYKLPLPVKIFTSRAVLLISSDAPLLKSLTSYRIIGTDGQKIELESKDRRIIIKWT